MPGRVRKLKPLTLMANYFRKVTTVLTLALDELETSIVKEIANSVPVSRIQAMQALSERLHVQFMREMTYSTGWTPQLRAARVLASADGLMSYHSTLRLKRLYKSVTLEEGGVPGSWTMVQKMAAAKCVYSVLNDKPSYR